MASKRMIDTDIWKDEFIGSLSFFERILWIGLITLADDQGRVLNNPIVILHEIYLYDENIKKQQIQECLNKFAEAGKVVIYEAGGKSLIQLVNWWKHQDHQWPQTSLYKAPKGWIDRIKEHIKGTKKPFMLNMDKKGGFDDLPRHLPSDLPCDLPCDLPRHLPSDLPYRIDDVNDDVNGEVEVEVEETTTTPYSRLSTFITNVLEIPNLTPNPSSWSNAIQKMVDSGITEDDVRSAYGELLAKNYTIVGAQSLVNASINAKIKRNGKPISKPVQTRILPDGCEEALPKEFATWEEFDKHRRELENV